MEQISSDPLNGELPNDADMDADGSGEQTGTGDGYVDPVEQDVNSQLPQGHRVDDPAQLP